MPKQRRPNQPLGPGGMKPRQHWLYSTWQSMITRCENPNHVRFKHYGGRGIKICREWRENFWTYVAAVEALGPRPEGGTIDRRDNDVGYEPGNIRWATEREQKLNYSGNHLMTWEGETLPLSSWADRFGVTYMQFWGRAHHFKYNMAKTVRSIEKLKREGAKPPRKLSDEDVITIRTEHAAGSATIAELAIRFGVHELTIRKVVVRETWRNVG
jgi:hypothetical protein